MGKEFLIQALNDSTLESLAETLQHKNQFKQNQFEFICKTTALEDIHLSKETIYKGDEFLILDASNGVRPDFGAFSQWMAKIYTVDEALESLEKEGLSYLDGFKDSPFVFQGKEYRADINEEFINNESLFPDEKMNRSIVESVVNDHIENMEDFTKEFVRGCQRNYYPDRVMIEYNGMYSIDDLMDVVDETDLELYQVIVTVDASTADLYLKNMKSMFMEMFKMADLVIFNRCDDNTNMGSFRRSIKAVNPRAQVGFERADGKEMEQDELLPYDVNAEVIKVEDEDYGIWYIDAMERPEVYEGKTVEMRVQVQRSPKMPPGMIIPGRKAMTCCEDDMTFIG